MKTNKQQKGILLTAVLMLAAIVTIVIIGLSLPEREEYIQGQAEASDYRVSCKVPARVLQLRVIEGDRVRRGDTLAVMEAPDVTAKLAQAEAARSAAEAVELKARNGAREEQIQGAYEVWQQAKAGLQVAEKTYRRIERLHGEGVIATQKFDEAQARYEASVATERAAKAQYDMAVNGARRGAGEPCAGGDSGSELLPGRDDSDCIRRRYRDRDFPRSGRTGRHGSAHHEHRPHG